MYETSLLYLLLTYYACHYYWWCGNLINSNIIVTSITSKKQTSCTVSQDSTMTYHSWLQRLHIFVDVFRIDCQHDDLLRAFARDADDSTANQFADVKQLAQAGHTLHASSSSSSFINILTNRQYHSIKNRILLLVRQGAFTCVGWQVTLCDPIWQVTLRSSEMGSLIKSYIRTFNHGELVGFNEKPFQRHPSNNIQVLKILGQNVIR